jgi:nicotinamidase-related amidase
MRTALLLIDVINDLVFPEGEQLLTTALPMATNVARLKADAARREIPIIYVNDNFGHWRSDFRAQVEHCQHDDVPGKVIAKLVAPSHDDYFVLKPMHSGFYGTALELLLRHLDVRRLILCGMATNICVFFTASDAYMRGFELWIPEDCVAANSEQLSTAALNVMQTVLKADIRPSTERGLDEWDDPTSGTVKHDRLLKEQ